MNIAQIWVDFNPVISLWLVAIFLLVLLSLHFLFLKKSSFIADKKTKKQILLLRAFIYLFFLLILANVKFTYEEPDNKSFVVGGLVDVSGSMQTRDMPENTSRLKFIEKLLNQKDGFFAKLQKKYQISPFVFSEKLIGVGEFSQIDPTHLSTDIDGALIELKNRFPEHLLGAVLLITDGNDTIDEHLIRAGEVYSNLGVPISIIGIGDKQEVPDLEIKVLKYPQQNERGKDFTIQYQLSKKFISNSEFKITLSHEEKVLKEEVISLTESHIEKSMILKNYKAGPQNYELSVEPIEGEKNFVNNRSFFTVEILEPKSWNILYIGGSFNWEYKFLKQQSDDWRQYHLNACILKDHKNYYLKGLDLGEENELNFEKLKDYQGLLIDANCFHLYPKNFFEQIDLYIRRVGGGVLVIGPYVAPAGDVDLQWQKILPLELTQVNRIRSDSSLVFLPNLFWGESSANIKNDWFGSIYLPKLSFYQSYGQQKLSAVPILHLSSGAKTPVLTMHHYSGSKVGYLGFDATWGWIMQNDNGASIHEAFWLNIFQILTSSAKPLVQLSPNYDTVSIGKSILFEAKCLDEKYQPLDGAKVVLKIFSPDKQQEPIEVYMKPHMRESGKYTSEVNLTLEGVHRLELLASFEQEGQQFLRRLAGKIIVESNQTEMLDVALKKELLMDLTYVTGGKYWGLDALDQIEELPVSKKVFTKKSVYYLNSGFILIICLLTLILLEIYIRRKNGFK